jgi:hypothetical protein
MPRLGANYGALGSNQPTTSYIPQGGGGALGGGGIGGGGISGGYMSTNTNPWQQRFTAQPSGWRQQQPTPNLRSPSLPNQSSAQINYTPTPAYNPNLGQMGQGPLQENLSQMSQYGQDLMAGPHGPELRLLSAASGPDDPAARPAR